MTLSMPPQWAPHERTLMGWPCRLELWEGQLAPAKEQYAGVANAIAAFEPVTMICASEADAAEARAALSAACEVVVLPIDDSWLRDSGPIYVSDDSRRVAVSFGFNAWGEKFHPYDKDQRVGPLIAAHLGDEVTRADLVLEGGSIVNDGQGGLITTSQCLLHPNRNPSLSQEQIEARVLGALGLDRMVWLGDGLADDQDTDGHVDFVAVPLAPGRVLAQSGLPGTPDEPAMAENQAILRAAGYDVIDFPVFTYGEVAGQRVMHPYLNIYQCNGAAIMGLAGTPEDEEALARVRAALPDREVVGVPTLTISYGGGGPHCITQQVPTP